MLWGLLAITFSQDDPSRELWVTPSYVMRKLGMEDRRQWGGYQYNEWFKAGLDRLAYVIYDASAFYVPDVNEYRSVVMGLLKRDLPVDLDASRQWRIRWDDTLFDLCQHDAGGLFFDLQMFLKLSPTTRRLFLLLLKIFNEGRRSPWFDVRDLSVSLLGYSPGLPLKKLKQNVSACAGELLDHGILRLPAGVSTLKDTFKKDRVGSHSIRFHAGTYFTKSPAIKTATPSVTDSPQYEPLKEIGFSDGEVSKLIGEHKASDIAKAADITQRAMRGGKDVPPIKKHPKAYFRYYVQGFAEKCLTPPDWYRSAEKRDAAQKRKECLVDASEVSGCGGSNTGRAHGQGRRPWQTARCCCWRRGRWGHCRALHCKGQQG